MGGRLKRKVNVETCVEFTDKDKVIQKSKVRGRSRTEPGFSLFPAGAVTPLLDEYGVFPPLRPSSRPPPSPRGATWGKECPEPTQLHPAQKRSQCRIPHPQPPRLLLSGQGHPGASTRLPSTPLLCSPQFSLVTSS